jgi:hypothetical protein
MLIILVGDVKPDMEVDLDASEMWAALMPKELVKKFAEFYASAGSSDLVIRIYTDPILNYVGEQIENGVYHAHHVNVFTEYGQHYFNPMGCIDKTWPYGLFNY